METQTNVFKWTLSAPRYLLIRSMTSNCIIISTSDFFGGLHSNKRYFNDNLSIYFIAGLFMRQWWEWKEEEKLDVFISKQMKGQLPN